MLRRQKNAAARGRDGMCVCVGGLPPTLDREHVTDQLSDVMCVRADVC